MNQALYFAETKMDKILNNGARILTTHTSDTPLGDDTMVRSWYGTTIPANTDLQLITVEVTWIETSGRTRQIMLRSYLAI